MFGKMIRFMRFTKKLKQTELADKLGIASSTLAHYESEYRAIPTFSVVNYKNVYFLLKIGFSFTFYCGIIILYRKHRDVYVFRSL